MACMAWHGMSHAWPGGMLHHWMHQESLRRFITCHYEVERTTGLFRDDQLVEQTACKFLLDDECIVKGAGTHFHLLEL